MNERERNHYGNQVTPKGSSDNLPPLLRMDHGELWHANPTYFITRSFFKLENKHVSQTVHNTVVVEMLWFELWGVEELQTSEEWQECSRET